MANSKTTTKSNTKSGSKSKSTVNPNLNVRNMKPGKAYNKQVTKKDGKVIATYQKLNETGLIDRTSKVRKVFDNKGIKAIFFNSVNILWFFIEIYLDSS